MSDRQARSAANIDPDELRIDTYTAGPNYSVRVVHLPTGLMGTSDQHKSLLAAKEEALTRLRERMETT